MTGKGICCTTKRRRVLVVEVIVADVSRLASSQVDGLTAPAVAPLDFFETGALAHLCLSSVAWKDSVTESFLHKSGFIFFCKLLFELLVKSLFSLLSLLKYHEVELI